MTVIEGFKVEEVIKDFTFREKGGIKILKEWRELAVICQVDIEIVSVSKENYRNYGSIPAHGFYGYASLVMRDFVSQPIKIQQSRQTIYYARNDSALSNWFTYLQQVRVQENYKAIENLICFNTVLLGGACVPVPCKDIPEFSFDEFPLREVMVKTFYGTQFKIEYSFWKLNNELSACGDIITPKSKQTDGDKDNGLPANGSAPQNTDRDNPYLDLPPADGTDKAGVLSLDKLNNQDNPNPDNAIIPSAFGYFLRVNATYTNEGNQCQSLAATYYYLVSEFDTSFTLTDGNPSTVTWCNIVHNRKILSGNYSGAVDSAFVYQGSLSYEVIRAADKPPNVIT